MMNFKRILMAGAAMALFGAGPAHSQPASPIPQADASLDPQKMATGRQIIAIMFPPEQRDAMMHALVTNMLAQYRASLTLPKELDDPGLMGILDEALNSIPDRLGKLNQDYLPKIHEAMAKAYTREFSAADLAGVLAFARTPAGQHYLQRSTAILGDPDVAAVNREFFASTRVMGEEMKADVMKKVTAYLRAHPDVAKRLEALNRKPR